LADVNKQDQSEQAADKYRLVPRITQDEILVTENGAAITLRAARGTIAFFSNLIWSELVRPVAERESGMGRKETVNYEQEIGGRLSLE